jgi:hypothetical protein
MLLNCPETKREKIEARLKELLGVDRSSRAPAWPLPNMKEVNERDFWGWRSSYSFEAEVWFGQIKTAEVDPTSQFGHPEWGVLLVYLVDHSSMAGGGFAVVYNYNARDCNAPEDKPGAKSVRYFKWVNCVHEFAQRNIGNCLNRYTCNKCGASHDIDSSG